ncbi:hypothetical protein CI102_9478 [Trichoderma harzianum]|nr:hypothetical protein CI102_9478 [Trichoderma harzianum]
MASLDLANVMVVIPSNQAGRSHPAVGSIDRNREPLSIHGDDREKIHLSVSRQNSLTLTIYERHTCAVGQTGIKHTYEVEGNGWTRRSTTQQQHGQLLVNGRLRDNRKLPSGICHTKLWSFLINENCATWLTRPRSRTALSSIKATPDHILCSTCQGRERDSLHI